MPLVDSGRGYLWSWVRTKWGKWSNGSIKRKLGTWKPESEWKTHTGLCIGSCYFYAFVKKQVRSKIIYVMIRLCNTFATTWRKFRSNAGNDIPGSAFNNLINCTQTLKPFSKTLNFFPDLPQLRYETLLFEHPVLPFLWSFFCFFSF